MKIFISSLEIGHLEYQEKLKKNNLKINFGLMSYFYLKKAPDRFEKGKQITKEILIDSGAHTFQEKEKKTKQKIDWVKYTKEYADWIAKNDCPQVKGYFEMDIDSSVGYKKVLELRKILENVTDKIIPVWHKNRGIDEYKKMCQSKKYPIVAITGFKNEDITDNQYLAFLKYAWKWGKKVHCLGMTRIKVLDKVPFNSTDSASWRLSGRYGEIRIFKKGKIKAMKVKNMFDVEELEYGNLRAYMKLSNYYNQKWNWINHDIMELRFVISRTISKLRGLSLCQRTKKLQKLELLVHYILLSRLFFRRLVLE